jgi:hypothetical protein
MKIQIRVEVDLTHIVIMLDMSMVQHLHHQIPLVMELQQRLAQQQQVLIFSTRIFQIVPHIHLF